MQNLSLVALLVLEIDVTKISWEQIMKFGYLPPENGFNLKDMTFYVQNRSSRPKIDPHVNFSNFHQAEENVSFSKFWGLLNEKRAVASPLIDQYC